MSSHLLAEVEQSADHVVVLGRGRLLADGPVAELVSASTSSVVLVTPDDDAAKRLGAHLPTVTVHRDAGSPGTLRLQPTTPRAVGEAVHTLGVRVHGLWAERARLEDAYRRLVDGSVEHTAGAATAGSPGTGRDA